MMEAPDVGNGEITLQALRAERDALAAQVRAQTNQLNEMRALLDSAPVGVWALRTDGRLAFVNQAFCQAVGISESTFISVPDYAVLYPPASASSCKQSDREALQSDAVHVSREYIRFADGTDHHLDIYKARVTDDEGQCTGLIAISVDVTDRVRLEGMLRLQQANLEAAVAQRTDELRLSKEAAERAALARSRFVSTMSHEMRTPLNAIIGLLPVVRASTDQVQRDRYLQTIGHSSELLLALVNDVLDLSRIESGRLRLESIAFCPRDLVYRACALLFERAASKGLILTASFDETLPHWLMGDAMRLSQILLNLLTNAVKFTDHGRVHVHVAAQELAEGRCQFQLTVQDTGIGIAPEQAGMLFEAFEQGDPSTARRFGGTGLGLAICRELLGCMQGRITFDSKPGLGSCFKIEVPLHVAHSEVSAASEAGHAQTQLLGRQVLLVDDEQVNLEVGRAMLENLGCVVTVADSGEQALSLAEAGAFDLILLDLHMPRLDGVEVARRLSARPESERVPILALTADVGDDWMQRCLQAGMSGILTKPLPLQRLCERLRAALDAVATP